MQDLHTQVQIQSRKHVLDHTDGMVPMLQHELDPTDQGYIFAERSRSPDEDVYGYS